MRTQIVIGLIGMAVALGAFQTLPRCSSVDPDTGKKGEMITVGAKTSERPASANCT